MISRRNFLISLSFTLPLANCATLPPDTTKRAGGVADPSAPSAAAWRPEAADATSSKQPAASPAPTGVQYTCSMHPEVLQPTPGDCPKCGMPLVRKEGGGGK